MLTNDDIGKDVYRVFPLTEGGMGMFARKLKSINRSWITLVSSTGEEEKWQGLGSWHLSAMDAVYSSAQTTIFMAKYFKDDCDECVVRCWELLDIARDLGSIYGEMKAMLNDTRH